MIASDVSVEVKIKTVYVFKRMIWIKFILFTSKLIFLCLPHCFIIVKLKCVFDRLFVVTECDSDYHNPKKESVFIMAAEGYGFEESEYWYDHLEKHLRWKGMDKILCGDVMNIGGVKGKPELNIAFKLGKSIQQSVYKISNKYHLRFIP